MPPEAPLTNFLIDRLNHTTGPAFDTCHSGVTCSRVPPFQVSRFLDTFQRFADHCYETIQMHRHMFNPQSTTTFYSIEYLLRSADATGLRLPIRDWGVELVVEG